MGRRFRPTASKLIERRREKDPRTNQVDIPTFDIDKDYLDKFLGRIFFWSFTMGKVKPYHHATLFRICTHRYVPKQKLPILIEPMFPEGCRIIPVKGYSFRHTFDVKTTHPMKWKEFIQRIVKALEGVL